MHSEMERGEGRDRADFSKSDSAWLDKIEQSTLDFHNLDLTKFAGMITCREIVESATQNKKYARELSVLGNTVFRIASGKVMAMIDSELQNIGTVNKNNRVIRSHRGVPNKILDPLNYPGRQHGIHTEYLIRPVEVAES